MTKRKRIEKLNGEPVWTLNPGREVGAVTIDRNGLFAAVCAVGVIVGWWLAVAGNY